MHDCLESGNHALRNNAEFLMFLTPIFEKSPKFWS